MKKFICLFTLILCSYVVFSQRGEKIKAYKTAFLTQELQLTPNEAERFWPIYNQYEQQLMLLRRKGRKDIIGPGINIDNLSDTEALVLIDKAINFKKDEFELEKNLVEKLKSILPPKKIIKLRQAEEAFKRKLLDRMRRRDGKD